MFSENHTVEIVGLFLTVFGSVWSLAWWLSGQFTAVRNLIYTQVEKLEQHFTQKLEYHERHDDSRFNNISNDLWDIKLRNAANMVYPQMKAVDTAAYTKAKNE